MDRAARLIVLLGTFGLICLLVVAGVMQKRMDLTVVALALVSLFGWLAKNSFNFKDDPP